jgi:hypothetical protein
LRACALGGYITTLKTSGSKRKELHDLGFLDKQIPKWVAPLERVSVAGAGAGAGSIAEQAQRAPPAAIPVGTPAIEQGAEEVSLLCMLCLLRMLPQI